jgi:transposase
MLDIESKYNCKIEEQLRKLYVDQGCSIHQVAKELGVTYMTAHRWLKQAGVYSHKLSI